MEPNQERELAVQREIAMKTIEKEEARINHDEAILAELD